MVDEINSRTSTSTWIVLIFVVVIWVIFFNDDDYKEPAAAIKFSHSYFEKLYLQEASNHGIVLKKGESGFYTHLSSDKKAISKIQSKISEEQSKILVLFYDQNDVSETEKLLKDASIKYRLVDSTKYETPRNPERKVKLLLIEPDHEEKARKLLGRIWGVNGE